MTLQETVALIRLTTLVAPILFIFIVTVSTRALLNAAKHPIQAVVIPVASAVLIFIILSYLPAFVEDFLNRGGLPFPDIHIQNAKKHHHRYDIADLHCDTLLWGHRDFLKTTYHPINNRPLGAVDVPRMLQGRVKLQVFAAVNSVPRTLNFEYNETPSHIFGDALVLKTILERWPMKTWFSPKQRVLHQFHRLKLAAKENSHVLQITRSKGELRAIRDTIEATQPVKAIMAVEGLSCLNEDISTVDEFFQAGIRILGPTHFFDTEVGGSRSGVCQCGLTDFGRHVLRRMKHYGMIADLAHASDQLIRDILDMSPEERPRFMISHTGIDRICPNKRNLGDEHIIRIAEAGGLVGVTLFKPGLCGDDVIRSFVDSVKHVSNITGGVQSVAIGSDWDGNVFTAVSAADTHILSAALLEIGHYSHADVKRIMYDNAFDFFMTSLPD